MLKPYDEMRKVDISNYTDQRDGMDYLNWAKCIDLLHEHGAKEVYFEPLKNENGSSLFMTDQVFTDKNGNTNRCYEVGVIVHVDDKAWIFTGPLMNGLNPVKDNYISQQQIWNCQTRLFVKCIAIHTGLGFNLWLKDEIALDKAAPEEDIYRHDIRMIMERIQQLITVKMDEGLSLDDIAEKTKLEDGEAVKDILRYCKKIYNFEGRLRSA